MRHHRIAILGGTGFVGHHLCAELSRRGYAMRVLTRRRERHRSLLVFPTLELVETDVHSTPDLIGRLAGCDALVNLSGILNESRRPAGTFEKVHAGLPGSVVDACRETGIRRLVHMSALNAAPDAPSAYLRTKAAGEEAAHAGAAHGIRVTSFRPSVIFGEGDSFFNRFATLLAVSPVFFPLACAGARFAPVWVGDVVRAFADSLEMKPTWGQRYELCGPRSYTLRELLEYTGEVSGHRRVVVPLGDGLSRLQASVLEHVPGKPFSVDNYLSTKIDSVCRSDGLAEFGIHPTGIETVVPRYLGGSGRTARYNELRSHAGRT